MLGLGATSLHQPRETSLGPERARAAIRRRRRRRAAVRLRRVGREVLTDQQSHHRAYRTYRRRIGRGSPNIQNGMAPTASKEAQWVNLLRLLRIGMIQSMDTILAAFVL